VAFSWKNVLFHNCEKRKKCLLQYENWIRKFTFESKRCQNGSSFLRPRSKRERKKYINMRLHWLIFYHTLFTSHIHKYTHTHKHTHTHTHTHTQTLTQTHTHKHTLIHTHAQLTKERKEFFISWNIFFLDHILDRKKIARKKEAKKRDKPQQ